MCYFCLFIFFKLSVQIFHWYSVLKSTLFSERRKNNSHIVQSIKNFPVQKCSPEGKKTIYRVILTTSVRLCQTFWFLIWLVTDRLTVILMANLEIFCFLSFVASKSIIRKLGREINFSMNDWRELHKCIGELLNCSGKAPSDINFLIFMSDVLPPFNQSSSEHICFSKIKFLRGDCSGRRCLQSRD